ncbi:MAG: putative glycosyltransferase, partial [Anaerolineales bacterium]|nr:putative glycosyltransferase [Anaerolineales bacterium]
VLFFSDSYGPHDFRFLSFLAESGLEVLFLRRHAGQIFEGRPLPEGVVQLPPLDPDGGRPRRLGVSLLDDLRRVLRKTQPDLVHAGPLQPCAWLVARVGFPHLVSMSWGSDLLDSSDFGLGRWQAAGTLRRTSVLLGDCEAVRRRAVELGMDEGRTVIFPWGVDLDVFRPGSTAGARSRLGWQGKLVVLCLRSWEPRYGVDVVVEGFLRAARREPSLRLILAGDGSLRPRLIDRIEASGLADRLWLPGYVPYAELPTLYHGADIYLSGSYSDGSSVSLLEAMACGLPAFVTDIPGNREWVEPGRTGRCFEAGDVDGLVRLLVHAPAMLAELKAFGRQARAIAEARADWRRNAPRILDAYAMALADDRGLR